MKGRDEKVRIMLMSHSQCHHKPLDSPNISNQDEDGRVSPMLGDGFRCILVFRSAGRRHHLGAESVYVKLTWFIINDAQV